MLRKKGDEFEVGLAVDRGGFELCQPRAGVSFFEEAFACSGFYFDL